MDKRLSFSLALWLVTIFLIALIIGTVKAYEAKGNFPSADKATFNVLMLIWVYLLEVSFLVSTTYSLTMAHQSLSRLLDP